MAGENIIDIKVSNDAQLAQAYASRGTAVYGKLMHMNAQVLSAFQRWVKSEAPHKTGKLKGAIMKTNYRIGGSVFMGKGAPYFVYVLDGTRPHWISFKNKKALFWKGAGHPVKRVHHPGTKANDFFDRGYQAAQSEVNKEIQLFENWLVN